MGSRFSRGKVIAAGWAVMAAVLTLTGCGGSDSGASTTASSSAPRGHDDQLALQIFDAIVRGDFKSATTNFDSTMQQQLSPDALSSAWTTYQEAFGKYQSHGDPQDVARGDLTVVNVPLQMAREPGEFRITFHPNATVAGLYFLKTGIPVS